MTTDPFAQQELELHCTLCGLIDGKGACSHIQVLSCDFHGFVNREHDKGPEEFSSVLVKLMDANVEFVVSILGEHTNDIPGTHCTEQLAQYNNMIAFRPQNVLKICFLSWVPDFFIKNMSHVTSTGRYCSLRMWWCLQPSTNSMELLCEYHINDMICYRHTILDVYDGVQLFNYSVTLCRLESVICGCYPLCPNRLVYPEIYPGTQYLV